MMRTWRIQNMHIRHITKEVIKFTWALTCTIVLRDELSNFRTCQEASPKMKLAISF